MVFLHLPFCQTEHLKAQIGEEFLCTLASSHLMWWSDKRWGESIKTQPKKWSQWYNSAPLHQTSKRFPHSDSKVTTVITRGLKKSPSSVLWKVIVSVLCWYLLLLYNLFFSAFRTERRWSTGEMYTFSYNLWFQETNKIYQNDKGKFLSKLCSRKSKCLYSKVGLLPKEENGAAWISWLLDAIHKIKVKDTLQQTHSLISNI